MLLISLIWWSNCGGQDQNDLQILRCVPIGEDGRKIDDDAECPRYQATIIQLLARPEIFDGKRVIVTGFLHVAFESRGLYIRRQDFDDRLWHNGLWLGTFSESVNECQDDTYVTLEGLFQSRRYGHYGLWSGMITDITRCYTR